MAPLSDAVSTLLCTVAQTNLVVREMHEEISSQLAQLKTLLLTLPTPAVPDFATSISISPSQLPSESATVKTAASTMQRLSTLTSTSRSSSCSGAGGKTKVKLGVHWFRAQTWPQKSLQVQMQWACKRILSAGLCLSTPIRARDRYSLW